MLQDQLRRVRARKVVLYYPTQQQQEPEKKRRRRCLAAPFLTCLCISVSLVVIGAVIALSLIPLFISSSDMTLADDESLALVELGYATNMTNMTSLTSARIKAYTTELENALRVTGKVSGTIQVQVESARSARSLSFFERVTRAGSCQNSGSHYLRVRFYISAPKSCRTKACLNKARQKAQDEIDNIYSSIFLSSVSESEQGAVSLGLCSSSISDFSSAKVTTTTSATLGSGDYEYYTSTTTPGRRKRAARSQVRQASEHSHMPIAGCLVIAAENNDSKLIKDLTSKYGMMKYLPKGIQVFSSSDENQTRLVDLLQEKKISKNVYNQMLLAETAPNRSDMTRTMFNQLQAHYRAWERVLQLNEPMLVLEETAHLNELLLTTMFPYVMYALPSNFSLFYFASSIDNGAEDKLIDYNDLLWKSNAALANQAAYIISPQGAATLIDSIFPLEKAIHSMISEIVRNQSLDVYVSKQTFVDKQSKPVQSAPSAGTDRQPPLLIPTTFHFIWLNNHSVPEEKQKYIQLWQQFHPNWTILIWTKELLAEQNVTLFNEELFQQSIGNIRQASDILRYEIVHQYGGIYLDLDFEPLRNIEVLLNGVQAFAAFESEAFLCNGIFGATPFHPFTARLIDNIKNNWMENQSGTTSQQTGPHYVTRQVKAMLEDKEAAEKDGFQVFAQHLFFPYTALEQDPGRPYDLTAFAVHHFRPIDQSEWLRRKQ